MTDDEVAQARLILAQPMHTALSGVSHGLHNERPEVVLEALKAFFRLESPQFPML